jgi:hypothetical protein
MVGRVCGGINIRRRDQQRGIDRKVRILKRGMSDENAPQAVRDQDRTGRFGNGVEETRDPLVAMRPVPVVLLDAGCVGKRSLQPGLPMLGARTSEAGNYENPRHRAPLPLPFERHLRTRAGRIFGVETRHVRAVSNAG